MRRLMLALASAVLAIACSDPMDPSLAPLLGNWRTGRIDIGSSYSREESLTFTRDGRIHLIMRFYQNGAFFDRYEATGTYMVRGDSLFTSFANPDIANGATVGFSRFNNGHIEFDGQNPRLMTITYPWFGPADESVTAIDRFAQTLCGLRGGRVVQVEGCLN
jgi:hypothetical protein